MSDTVLPTKFKHNIPRPLLIYINVQMVFNKKINNNIFSLKFSGNYIGAYSNVLQIITIK